MSRTRQMIELSAPSVLREYSPERFTVKGFTCPDCNGNGWCGRQDYDDADADNHGWCNVACPTCGGTGELDAEVMVSWKKQGKEAAV